MTNPTIFQANSDCGKYVVTLERDANGETGKVITHYLCLNKLMDIDTVVALPVLRIEPFLKDVETRLAHRRGFATHQDWLASMRR